MPEFQVGDHVDFQRDGISINDTIIIAVVPIGSSSFQNIPVGQLAFKQYYIIEYQTGWTPNCIRAQKFSLDVNKKYLFVRENELTPAL